MPRDDDKNDLHKGVPANHPSYGAVNISRVQGNRTLFRSSVPHPNYIELTFYEAELERDFHTDDHTLNKPILAVAFSYAQFASLVGMADRWTGVPCTITRRWVDGKYKLMPEPPLPDEVSTLNTEIEKKANEISSRLNELEKKVRDLMEDKKKAGMKDLKEILAEIDLAKMRTREGIPFLEKMARERVEELKQEVNIEAESALDLAFRKVGIEVCKDDPERLRDALRKDPPGTYLPEELEPEDEG